MNSGSTAFVFLSTAPEHHFPLPRHSSDMIQNSS